jgi:hypothetical protein
MIILVALFTLVVVLSVWRVLATSQHLPYGERIAWLVAVVLLPIVGLVAFAALRSTNKNGPARA